MNLDPTLLEILRCPSCRAEVREADAADELVCTGCGLVYPVENDVPVMLVDSARPGASGTTTG
ncbi:MAG: Trm112 family protein [Marmoricola sp.]